MSAQVAADLRAAAEVLRRDGWMQGDSYADAGPRCAIGSIVTALKESGELRREPSAYAALRSHLGGSVVEFNDTPERTADEVIAALEAAADAAEATS